jgi:transposase InsO family protein
VRRTLAQIGIPRATFYRWYELHRTGGPEALADRPCRPDRVWNRIPDTVRERIVQLALDQPEMSPRELAVRFTDRESYFVSEASVYRLLKAHDLISSPAFVVMKAADAFTDKTTAPNQLWQTDFTYLKVIGWGWFYLSTVLDDFSRYVIAWKLCTTMKTADVTETLQQALQASGLDRATVQEGLDEATILGLVATGLGVAWVLGTARWRRPKRVVIMSVVDLNVPMPLALAWRKDNKSPLLARFVVEVQRLPDVRAVNKG